MPFFGIFTVVLVVCKMCLLRFFLVSRARFGIKDMSSAEGRFLLWLKRLISVPERSCMMEQREEQAF